MEGSQLVSDHLVLPFHSYSTYGYIKYLFGRAAGNLKVSQLALGQIVDPAVHPDVLALLAFVRPRVHDRRRHAQVLDLHLDVLLNDQRQRLSLGHARELERRDELGERGQPLVERRIGREAGVDHAGLCAGGKGGRARSTETRSGTSTLSVADDDDWNGGEKTKKSVGMAVMTGDEERKHRVRRPGGPRRM